MLADRVALVSDVVERIITKLKEEDVQAGSELPDLSYYERMIDQARKGKSHHLFGRNNIRTDEVLEWWGVVGEQLKKNVEEGLDYSSLGALLDKAESKPQ